MSPKIPDDYILKPEDDHMAVVAMKFMRACQDSQNIRFQNIEKKVEDNVENLNGKINVLHDRLDCIDRVWMNSDTGRLPQAWSAWNKLKAWAIGLVLLLIGNIAINVVRGMGDIRSSAELRKEVIEAIKESQK